jgi:cytochrome c-type protein NrfB
MSHIGLLLKRSLAVLIPLLFLSFTPLTFVQAAESAKPTVKPGDRACLTCHRKTPMEGAHAHAVNPNNLGDVNCSNCHGRISKNHRAGAKDVMRYTGDMYSVEDQNSVCMSCHEPEKLRESFWQHDVHVTKIACSNCHVLHPTSDPMEGMNENKSAKIKLCVDCHSNIHQEVAKKKETP